MGSIPVRVTKEIPTLLRRNFFVSEPVRESKGRPRRGGKHAGGMFSRPWEIPPRQDLTGKEPYRTRWGAEPSRGHQKSSDTPVSELFCIRTRTGVERPTPKGRPICRWHIGQAVGDSPQTGPRREGTSPDEVGSGAFPGLPKKFRRCGVGIFLYQNPYGNRRAGPGAPPRYQPLRRPKYPLGIVTGQKSRETSGVRGAKAVGPADLVAYWSGRGRFPPDRT